jgi:hypothetical protein
VAGNTITSRSFRRVLSPVFGGQQEGEVKVAEIRERLNKAVQVLNEKDRYLLENDLSERCIASRLAMYLQPLFPDQVVDVEYNRAGDMPKRLNLPDECANFRDADGRSLVVPDIIVHTRGPNGPNLLVLELKKTTNWEGVTEHPNPATEERLKPGHFG